MKRVFAIVFIFLTSLTYGQDKKLLDILPVIEGKVTYSGVIQVDSADKNELYLRAKKWFVDTYKSAKDVIQLDDKENGEVIGKGYFKANWQVTFMSIQSVDVWHTITVAVKDNRFKYTITDFVVKYYVTPSTYSRGGNNEFTIEDFGKSREKNAKKFFTQIDTEVQSTILALTKFMQTKAKSDW
jgi:hypothetical protein